MNIYMNIYMNIFMKFISVEFSKYNYKVHK